MDYVMCHFTAYFWGVARPKSPRKSPPSEETAACQQAMFNNNKHRAFIGRPGILYLYARPLGRVLHYRRVAILGFGVSKIIPHQRE